MLFCHANRQRSLWGQAAIVVAAVLVAAAFESTAIAYRDSFETPHPQWSLSERDCQVVVLAHERSADQPHSGQLCEHWHLSCSRGTKLYLAYPVPPAYVIDELRPSVWVRADRAGIELLVRVVLPHARDPDSGRPHTVLVAGMRTTIANTWQLLRVDQIPLLLRRQQRILRARYGSDIDARDAYIDLIVLNAHCGPGRVQLWIDDLQVDGMVPVERAVEPVPNDLSARTAAASDVRPAIVERSVLRVQQQPLFTRMVDWNGEPLSMLASLGFNVVRLRQPPTEPLLEQARQANMWVVAPPPRGDPPDAQSTHPDPILAWEIGHQLDAEDWLAAQRAADAVRSADRRWNRPLMVSPTQTYSRFAELSEIVLLERPIIGTYFELADYQQWLRRRIGRLPATACVWAAVDLDVSADVAALCAAWSGEEHHAEPIELWQLRLQAYHALAAGVRGIYIRSARPLNDGNDHRAMLARLVNRELEQLAPWAAAGWPATTLNSSDPQVQVAVLQTERARLLIALRREPAQQWVVGGTLRRPVSIVDNAAAAAARAYRYEPPLGLVSVQHERRPDGLHIVLPSIEPIAVVVVTSQSLVLDHFGRLPVPQRFEFARARHEVTRRSLERTSRVLAMATISNSDNDGSLDGAIAGLEKADRLLATGDLRAATAAWNDAMVALAQVRREVWQSVRDSFAPDATAPLGCLLECLPVRSRWAAQLKSVRWSPNMLAGGELDSRDVFQQSGWRFEPLGDDTAGVLVEIRPIAARSGRAGLRIECRSHDQLLADDPHDAQCRIVTPPVAVQRGQLVRLAGWVNFARTSLQSPLRIWVADSIAGTPLAQPLQPGPGWQLFTIDHLATRDGNIQFAFLAAGEGEIWIDDVSLVIATSQDH